METLRLASRGSPLALAQVALTEAYLGARMSKVRFERVIVETTGDRQSAWSLEQRGGTGLFTVEVERAVREGRADIAVHSAKDLPSKDSEGLCVAGFLPREDARDVLVLREGVHQPKLLATGSPRRRAQAVKGLVSDSVAWTQMRGNVHTRLNKIVEGVADGTFLARAGLNRLGIAGHEGLVFRNLDIEEMVPAGGQGAVALQCEAALAKRIGVLLDERTRRAVEVERQFLARLGVGCHTAFGVHCAEETLWIFHEKMREPLRLAFDTRGDVGSAIDAVIAKYGLARLS